MHRLFPSCKNLLLTLFAVLALSACSRLGLAYRNLDVLIPWSMNEYLDMTPEQEQLFDTQLREHLSWHCRTQLPAYLDWLTKLRTMVESGQVSQSKLEVRLTEAKQALNVIAKEVTPSTVKLLRELNDPQVSELFSALDKDMLERQKKFLEPPLQEQIDERAKRMEKRLTPWLGKLNQAQRQRVKQWSKDLGAQNQQWLANRTHWQSEFRAAILQRHAPDFPKRIARLLQEREELWSADYREAFSKTEQAAIKLLVDVLELADDKQRARLSQQLSNLQLEFSSLKCLQET